MVAVAALLPARPAFACWMEWTGAFQYQEIVFVSDLSLAEPKPETLVANIRDERRKGTLASGPAADRDEQLPPFLRSCAVSPDGKKIALLNKKDSRLRLNDATGTGSLMLFEKHLPELFVWSADSASFAMSEPDGKGGTRLALARVAEKASREVALADLRPFRIVFADAGSALLAVSRTKVALVPVKEGEAKTLFEGKDLQAVAAGAGGRAAVVDGEAVLFFDPAATAPPQKAFSFPTVARVTAMAWAPGAAPAVLVARGKELWRVEQGGTAAKLGPAPASPIHTVAVAPDGQRIATLSDDQLFVLDAAGKPLYDTVGGGDVSWTRDSKALLLASDRVLVSIDTAIWAERALVRGSPVKGSEAWDTKQMAFFGPDFLGDKLVFTLYRIAGQVNYGP